MFLIEKSDLDFAKNYLGDLSSFFKKKSFLITGASGFFGKNLLEILSYIELENSYGIKVYALSRDKKSFVNNFPLATNVDFIEIIESDIINLKNFDKKIDYIIHAACDTRPEILQNSAQQFLSENYHGCLNLLEIAKTNKGCKFLYISSGAIYGSQNSDIKLRQENDLLSPNLQNFSSVYGEAKRICEMICTVYSQQYQVNTKVARCFSFVGPYMNFNGHYAIGNFIKDVASNQNIILKSRNQVFRSYLYSIDLIIWLLKILFLSENNSVYNVGSSQEILIEKLAQIVINLLNNNLKIVYSDELSFNTSMSSRYIPCVAKVTKDLNLQEFTSLEKAIKKTYNWYKNNSL